MASQNKKVELALRRARADGVLLLSNCGLSALPPVAFDLIAGWSGGDGGQSRMSSFAGT